MDSHYGRPEIEAKSRRRKHHGSKSSHKRYDWDPSGDSALYSEPHRSTREQSLRELSFREITRQERRTNSFPQLPPSQTPSSRPQSRPQSRAVAMADSSDRRMPPMSRGYHDRQYDRDRGRHLPVLDYDRTSGTGSRPSSRRDYTPGSAPYYTSGRGSKISSHTSYSESEPEPEGDMEYDKQYPNTQDVFRVMGETRGHRRVLRPKPIEDEQDYYVEESEQHDEHERSPARHQIHEVESEFYEEHVAHPGETLEQDVLSAEEEVIEEEPVPSEHPSERESRGETHRGPPQRRRVHRRATEPESRSPSRSPSMSIRHPSERKHRRRSHEAPEVLEDEVPVSRSAERARRKLGRHESPIVEDPVAYRRPTTLSVNVPPVEVAHHQVSSSVMAHPRSYGEKGVARVRKVSKRSMPSRPAEGPECHTCNTPSDDIRSLGCGHLICAPCIVNLFTDAIEDGDPSPPRCCLNGPISFKHAETILSPGIKSAWNRLYIEDKIRNGIYCPSLACGVWIKEERIKTDAQGRRYAKCDECGCKACVKCRGKWHPAKRCRRSDEGDDDLRQCYECQQWNKLEDYKAHMTCRCGIRFCTICSKKWKTCSCARSVFKLADSEGGVVTEEHQVRDRGDGYRRGRVPAAGKLLPARTFDAVDEDDGEDENEYARVVEERQDQRMASRLNRVTRDIGGDEESEHLERAASSGGFRTEHPRPRRNHSVHHAPMPASGSPFEPLPRPDYHSDLSKSKGHSGRDVSQEQRLADRFKTRSSPPAAAPQPPQPMALAPNPNLAMPMMPADQQPLMPAHQQPLSPLAAFQPMIAPPPHHHVSIHMPQMQMHPQHHAAPPLPHSHALPRRRHTLEGDLYNPPVVVRLTEKKTPRRTRTEYMPNAMAHSPRAMRAPRPRPKHHHTISEDEDEEPRPPASAQAGLNMPGSGMDRVWEWREYVEPGDPDKTAKVES